MCLRRAPEKYITGAMPPVGAALDRADVDCEVGTECSDIRLMWFSLLRPVHLK
jgi:hypothetical protein